MTPRKSFWFCRCLSSGREASCHLPRQIPYRLHREKQANAPASRVCCYASWQDTYAVPAYNSKRRQDSLRRQARTPGSSMKGWLNPELVHGLTKHTESVSQRSFDVTAASGPPRQPQRGGAWLRRTRQQAAALATPRRRWRGGAQG